MTSELLHAFLIDLPEPWRDQPAVDSRHGGLSYGELQNRVCRLAAWLQDNGCAKQDKVAICLPKRVASVEFILATLYLGAIYVPVDCTAPVERIKKIVSDSEAVRVITLPEIELALSEAGIESKMITSISNINELSATDELIARVSELACAPKLDVNDLAAFLYTSGSTGNPKGVMLSHQNIAVFSRWVVKRYSITGDDRLTSHAPFHFDLSTMDLYSTFMAGACVYILDEVEKRFPSTLTKVIQEKRITSWYSVPSALMLLEEKGALDKRDLSSLRQIFFAGEVYPLPALRKIMTRLPEAKFSNLYGPTETNVCTYYDMPGVPDEENKSIPIGRVCEHYSLSILDDSDKALAPGEMGEIVITGPGVMKGYWKAEEKTADARIDNAADSYRTGDFGILQADGNVIYMGRKDAQVKIQGYRVELNEIENIANTHDLVKESAALVLEKDDIKHIYLSVAAVNGSISALCEEDLLSWCAKELPTYAMPEKILVMDQFERTSTGKIDRQSIVRSVEQWLNQKA